MKALTKRRSMQVVAAVGGLLLLAGCARELGPAAYVSAEAQAPTISAGDIAIKASANNIKAAQFFRFMDCVAAKHYEEQGASHFAKADRQFSLKQEVSGNTSKVSGTLNYAEATAADAAQKKGVLSVSGTRAKCDEDSIPHFDGGATNG